MTNQNIEDLMQQRSIPARERTQVLRDMVRESRDLSQEIAGLEDRLKELQRKQNYILRERLPEMFIELGVSKISLEREGNMPAFEAILHDYYHASIATSWDATRKQAAFECLEKLHLSGLITNEVVAEFKRGETEKAKALVTMLQNRGTSAHLDQTVPWKRLTAAIKELCETGRRPSDGDLDSLGAVVGKVVKIKGE